MARIPYFDPSLATGRAKAQYEKLPPFNLFLMLGHAGDMMDGFVKLGNQILLFSKLDPILRELAIVRVGVLSKATYEVYQHEKICAELGMPTEKIRAIHEGASSGQFDELEKLVLNYTDDVVKNVRASDETFNPLLEKLSYRELQELTIAIGYYMMVSRFLETFGIDIEEEGKEARIDFSQGRA